MNTGTSDTHNNFEALIEAAREGHAEDVARLLPTCSRIECSAALEEAVRESVESDQEHNQCIQLLIPASEPMSRDNNIALRLAAINGNAEYIRALLPVADPLFDDSKPLMYAANNGNVECLQLLLPVSDARAKHSRALRAAARNGHVECVRLLIPHSDPRADNNCALRTSVIYGQTEVCELLLDVSDIEAALQQLTEDNWADTYFGPLRQRIKAKEEHALLVAEVTSEQHALKKKM